MLQQTACMTILDPMNISRSATHAFHVGHGFPVRTDISQPAPPFKQHMFATLTHCSGDRRQTLAPVQSAIGVLYGLHRSCARKLHLGETNRLSRPAAIGAPFIIAFRQR